MFKRMFCPKCGAGDQSSESYCKRCGEWLPDLDALGRPGLFRRMTREQRIRKMRVLEAGSAGLSLIAAAIIISILAGRSDTHQLFFAAFCCFVVALYQVINFYLGYKLQQRGDRGRAHVTDPMNVDGEENFQALSAGDTNLFVSGRSAVENTTELLDRVPRKAKRDPS